MGARREGKAIPPRQREGERRDGGRGDDQSPPQGPGGERHRERPSEDRARDREEVEAPLGAQARDRHERREERARAAAGRVRRREPAEEGGPSGIGKLAESEERRVEEAEHGRRGQDLQAGVEPPKALRGAERRDERPCDRQSPRDGRPARLLEREHQPPEHARRGESPGRRRVVSAESPCRQRAAGEESHEDEREHRGEGVDAVADGRRQQVGPEDFEREEQKSGEEGRRGEPPCATRRGARVGGRDGSDPRPPRCEIEDGGADTRETVDDGGREQRAVDPPSREGDVGPPDGARDRPEEVQCVEPAHGPSRVRRAHRLEGVDHRRKAGAHEERRRQHPRARDGGARRLEPERRAHGSDEDRHRPPGERFVARAQEQAHAATPASSNAYAMRGRTIWREATP